MTGWRISGRFLAAPPPADWRDQLAQRLGQKPRRLGRWAELVLYGALGCLESAGVTFLPASARIRLSTVHGPDLALRAALEEARDGLPLPMGFLQSQPNQALAHLAKALDWRGDAVCLSHRDPIPCLQGACSERPRTDLLLGWVSEADDGDSRWLYLTPDTERGQPACPTDFESLFSASLTGFTL